MLLRALGLSLIDGVPTAQWGGGRLFGGSARFVDGGCGAPAVSSRTLFYFIVLSAFGVLLWYPIVVVC